MVRILKIHSHAPQPKPHSAQREDRVYLEITRGTARRPMRLMKEPVYLIGRSHDCDLVLGDAQFGDVHAYLYRTDHRLFLRWLGGGPEVSVNGEVTSSTVLHDEDRIRTGPFEFFVHVCSANRRPIRAEIRKSIRMHSPM
ncbi:MAG: FHA domain-containing protein [Planctomycetales bacterium]|nr:FHA domain-containing protein [Planctomycetales bacterium]